MSGLIDKIAVLGREFTIQTEFIPGPEAKVRTLVYDGGRLVTSREIKAGEGSANQARIDDTVHLQHKRVTETLLTRAAELEAAKTGAAPPAASPPVAVERPPAPTSSTPRPKVTPGSRLATAIAIRQTIGPFALAFACPAPTTAEGYQRRLEAVEAAIDAIRDAPTYHHIRLDEQLTLIALKSQLETWRMADCDLVMATEIWPTVESFARHLQKINHRSDLVTFDHQLLTWAMSELGKGVITPEIVDALLGMGGRDAELDAFLRNPDGAEPMQLLEILLRLLDQTLA